MMTDLLLIINENIISYKLFIIILATVSSVYSKSYNYSFRVSFSILSFIEIQYL